MRRERERKKKAVSLWYGTITREEGKKGGAYITKKSISVQTYLRKSMNIRSTN